MAKATPESTGFSYAVVTRRQMIETVIIGAFTGALVWILATVLEPYVFGRILCIDGSSVDRCASALTYANAAAMILGSIAGVLMLVRAFVPRPLIVSLAAAVSLWGVLSITGTFVWLFSFFTTIVLFALAYAVYGWLARIHSIVISLITIVLLVLIARLVLTA